MSHGGWGLLSPRNPLYTATRIEAESEPERYFLALIQLFFVWELNLCAEIPRQNPFGGGKCLRETRDSPPKPCWRGKTSADNTR